MSERWPDVCEDQSSPIVCPRCLAERTGASRTFYALNTNRYVCTSHGPVLTGEMVRPRADRRTS